MERATASACSMLPGPGQRPRDLRQGLRLPARVGDGAGHRLGLPGDRRGLLVLPGPGQRLRHLRQGLRLRWSGSVMERATVSACPATAAAC